MSSAIVLCSCTLVAALLFGARINVGTVMLCRYGRASNVDRNCAYCARPSPELMLIWSKYQGR
jgi:hypothetical protein